LASRAPVIRIRNWQASALIMQAFSSTKDRDYENSRASAQAVPDFYPRRRRKDAAYAQYLLALSFNDQDRRSGPRPGLTFSGAANLLRAVTRAYSDSEWPRSADVEVLTSPSTIVGRQGEEIGRLLYSSAITSPPRFNRSASLSKGLRHKPATPPSACFSIG